MPRRHAQVAALTMTAASAWDILPTELARKYGDSAVIAIAIRDSTGPNTAPAIFPTMASRTTPSSGVTIQPNPSVSGIARTKGQPIGYLEYHPARHTISWVNRIGL